MGLLDAIDKILEPLTTKIFSTSFGKNIQPLSGEELFYEPDTFNDISNRILPGNINHRAWEENQRSMFHDD